VDDARKVRLSLAKEAKLFSALGSIRNPWIKPFRAQSKARCSPVSQDALKQA
jgi:hypothetical protein